MSDLVKQSIAELQDLVRCRCHPSYKDRGLHDPDCECDNAENVKVVAARIKELEAKLAEAVEDLQDMLTIPNSEAAQGILKAYVSALIAELTGGKDE